MLWIVSLGEEAKNVRSIDVPNDVEPPSVGSLLRSVPLLPVKVLDVVRPDTERVPPLCALWDVVSPRDFLELDNAGPVLETLLLGHQRYRRRESAWGLLTPALGNHLASTVRPGWAFRDFRREWIVRRPIPRGPRSITAPYGTPFLGARP
jgi:hypothetical protein